MGHYGSGKTSLAANFALDIRRSGNAVSVADIDIVNPYYRTKDWADEFASEGIELIALPYANTNLDLPSLPSEIYGLLQRRDRYAVLDIGGDDRGALALGRFRDMIKEEGNYDAWFVVNFKRPLTRTPEEALASMAEIAEAARMNFTGIVNNTNLSLETTAETVINGALLSKRLSEQSGLPLVYTAVEDPGLIPEGTNVFFGTEGIKKVKIKRIL